MAEVVDLFPAGDNRGQIRHPARRLQILDFRGLRFGRITPTDSDLSVDFGPGQCFVFGEFKYRGASLELGQRMHLEVLCKAIADCPPERQRFACAFVADHHVHDTGESVDTASCGVREVYWRRSYGAWQWVSPRAPIAVRELFDALRAHWGCR